MVNEHSRSRILVVDDEPTNLKVLRQVLHKDYLLSFAKSGKDALALIEKEPPDLILLDVMMPEMSGFDVCALLKQGVTTQNIPIIFVTALNDELDEANGFQLGAVDYIVKPIVPAVVKARVSTHLSLVKSEVLKQTQIELIERLGRAAEYKDNETGLHVKRMSQYSHVLALAYGLDEECANDILEAAPMHDIGKIATPDSILLKPGKLTDEEFDEMKRHAAIGAEILGGSSSRLIQLASSVARHHHEKWDGSGYPEGLSGKDIPLEARIVAVADVFDALTSVRPYKKAWTVDETMTLFREQSGKHFDPKLVALLEQELPKILEIGKSLGMLNDVDE